MSYINQQKVRSKRILFCCGHFGIGGLSSFTINFGRCFREMGYRVGALVTEPYGELAPAFFDALDEVDIVRRGLETRSAFLRRVVGAINRWGADVVINSRVPFVQAAFPYLSVPAVRISVVHNILASEIGIGATNLDHLEAVVGVSEAIRVELQARAAGRVRAVKIPESLVCNQPFTPRSGPDTTLLRLLFVGRLAGQKNLPGLVNIAVQLREAGIPFRVTIVGDGGESARFGRILHSRGVAQFFDLVGSKSRTEVQAILEQHDYFLMTSHFEGTPHTLLEAMAAGLVAVASRLPGSTDEIILHGVDGFLCNKDAPGEYVSVLRKLRADVARFRAVSQAAQLKVRREYDVRKLAQQYEELFAIPRRGAAWPVTAIARGARAFPPGLAGECFGLVWQVKHRLADVWHSVAHGRQVVRISGRMRQG